jgi:hypothetical protein
MRRNLLSLSVRAACREIGHEQVIKVQQRLLAERMVEAEKAGMSLQDYNRFEHNHFELSLHVADQAKQG